MTSNFYELPQSFSILFYFFLFRNTDYQSQNITFSYLKHSSDDSNIHLRKSKMKSEETKHIKLQLEFKA